MSIDNIVGHISDTAIYGTEQIGSATATDATAKASATQDTIPAAAKQSVPSGSNALPQLPDPLSKLSGMLAAPSLSADILSLVQELTDDERRANTEQRIASSRNVVEELHNQADDMRTQAKLNLALGVTAASIQIAAGTVQTVGASINLSRSFKGNLSSEQLTAANAKWGGITEGIKGLATIFSSVKEYENTTYEAKLKDRDAQIEMIRAYIAQLDSLNDALKEVIRSARENQNTIQQNTNQTRVKILS